MRRSSLWYVGTIRNFPTIACSFGRPWPAGPFNVRAPPFVQYVCGRIYPDDASDSITLEYYNEHPDFGQCSPEGMFHLLLLNVELVT